MPKLIFTQRASDEFDALERSAATLGVFRAVRKALAYLEINPRHPGLRTHEYTSVRGPRGEKIFEAYAQNQTPGAYRIFWHYGPDEIKGDARVAVVAITPHP